jgi:hypothetical protein
MHGGPTHPSTRAQRTVDGRNTTTTTTTTTIGATASARPARRRAPR